jgi:hypothetical protein
VLVFDRKRARVCACLRAREIEVFQVSTISIGKTLWRHKYLND